MAWLVDRIVAAILSWLASKGIRLVERKQLDREIDERVTEEADAVKKAATPDEFDNAAKDILSR